MDLREMFPNKLGFGGLRLPILNGEKDQVDYKETCRMVDEYVAHGGTYFDTSYIYHKGRSEDAFAACVVDRLNRNSFCLADKLPLWKVGGDLTCEQVFESQLKRCHVDYFDFYLLHNMNRNAIDFANNEDVFEFQKKLKREGKIRYAGMSFHDTPEMLEQLIKKHDYLDFVQLQINYYDWLSGYVEAKKCYQVAADAGLPVAVVETIRGGGLIQLPAAAKALMAQVDPKLTPAALALRFVASLDNTYIVLSGMSNLGQVQENCSVMGADVFERLTDDEYELIDQIRRLIRASWPIDCIQCGACASVCPEGLPVDKMMAIYADGQTFGDLNFPTMHYAIHCREKKADQCIRCGACQQVCPRNVEIIDVLRYMKENY